jgi:hypothetical protein
MKDKVDRTRRLVPLVMWLLVLLIPIVSGCARARAKTVPTLPPLDMPAPPPRIVLPMQAEAEVQEPLPAAEEPRRPQPPPTRPRATPPARDASAAEPPPPATAPPVPAAPPAPNTVLQTTPAAEQGEVERGIRATMTRATAELNRIDYRVLNADARSQYDTAKRFVQQADDAIRMKNLPFAKNLADKAAALAAQLGGNK